MKSPLATLVSNISNRTAIPFTSSRSLGLGGWQKGDRTEQLKAYGSVGTLFQIVHSLAEDTSRVQWHMHRIRQRSAVSTVCPLCDEVGVEPILDHQALRVWNKPNDFMSGQEFREGYQQHVDLTGEGYWVIDYDSMFETIPVGMWYVRPDRMTPVPDPEQFLVGWIYRSPDGEEVPLELNKVVQTRMPSPLDPYRGMGPVQTTLFDIGAAQQSAAWTANFFQNSAQPGGIIKSPTELSDPQFNKLVLRWGEQHRGVSNAHRVAILEGGLEWVDRSYSPKDMILTELRTFSSDAIREAFGFPKFAAGIVTDVNRANADASSAWYTQRLIVPRLERVKGALNEKFLPLFGATGKNVQFAYSDPVPRDADAENAERASKTSAYKTLVDAGVNPEDAAMVCGLPPMRSKVSQDSNTPALAGAAV